MCDDETTEVKAVAVPRLTLAGAIDLLNDYRSEMERAEATGPYSEELSTTVNLLEKSYTSAEHEIIIFR